MWQCDSCVCGVGLWRPRNCRTACGHSAQGMVWVTLLECIAPLRTAVLVGDHGCVPAHVGTLCTSVHLLEQLVPKNQSPQSHRGRRPPLASLGAHSLCIAIVPPPIATQTLVQFRASPNLFQLEIGLVARIGGLWHQSDCGEVHLRQLSLGAPSSRKWNVVQKEAMLCYQCTSLTSLFAL